jgi:DNA-damage-inducible protein J
MDQEHSEAYIVLIDAMLLLKRVAAEKAFPFEPLVLNAETVDAMRAARRGETAAVGHPSNLIASLNSDR